MKYIYLTLVFLNYLNASDIRALLFHGNCFTCHNEEKHTSAPSINEIKKNYIRAFPLKKDFIDYMSKWVIKPNKETSIMQEAIKKYKLMPELAYELSTLNEITAYIYDTNFSKKQSYKSSYERSSDTIINR